MLAFSRRVRAIPGNRPVWCLAGLICLTACLLTEPAWAVQETTSTEPGVAETTTENSESGGGGVPHGDGG